MIVSQKVSALCLLCISRIGYGGGAASNECYNHGNKIFTLSCTHAAYITAPLSTYIRDKHTVIHFWSLQRLYNHKLFLSRSI